MGWRLEELAARVGGEVKGDGGFRVEAVRALASAGPADLSFLTQPRYRAQAAASSAGALLVPEPLPGLDRPQLVAPNAYLALARILELMHPRRPPAPGVHRTAVVGGGCALDPSCHVGAYAVIGDGCRIGAGAIVHPHVVLGEGCEVGADAEIHPGAVLYAGSRLGARAVLHAGAVVGSDGFGYAADGEVHHKVPQLGRAVVEDDVEIGANTTIDRALLEETRIGAGTKIDNLVQVGHNVVTGRRCLLVAQSGIAGSTRLGEGVVLAGQAGVAGHVELGDGARVAAKSAVFKAVPAGRQVAGIPAVEAGAWRRQQAWLGRLPGLARRLAALERRLTGPEAGAPAAEGSAEDGTEDDGERG